MPQTASIDLLTINQILYMQMCVAYNSKVSKKCIWTEPCTMYIHMVSYRYRCSISGLILFDLSALHWSPVQKMQGSQHPLLFVFDFRVNELQAVPLILLLYFKKEQICMILKKSKSSPAPVIVSTISVSLSLSLSW